MDPGCRVLFNDERYPAVTTIPNNRNAFIFTVLKAPRPFKISVFTSRNGVVEKKLRLKSSYRDSVFFHTSRPAVRPTRDPLSSSVKRPH